MSKNLNNNYSSDSTTNLQIVSLTTEIETLTSSLTTVQSYSVTDASTISAAITNNNTLYVLPLFSTYLTSSLTNSAILQLH